MNETKKILILGSEGFIGSHAVRYFQDRGYQVFKADIVLKQENQYFLINPEALDFKTIFLSQVFDYCINATGAANVQLSYAHPNLDYTLNVANVHNILNCIRLYSPECKFINLSSAAVYGNPKTLPISETNATQPLSPYGYHKWFSELVCLEFYELFKIQTLSVRIFSAYGPGLKKQIFWDLYEKALKTSNKKVQILGTGMESRDFIYVEDIVHALEIILTREIFTGQKLNIATGVETSIQDASSMFFKLFNPEIALSFTGSTKEGDPINWRADIQVLSNLGFKTEYSLEQGLEKTTTWLKSIR